jgi:hypothetical protein
MELDACPVPSSQQEGAFHFPPQRNSTRYAMLLRVLEELQSDPSHDSAATYGTATNGDTEVAYTHATWADVLKGTCGAEKANDNISNSETFLGDHSLEYSR